MSDSNGNQPIEKVSIIVSKGSLEGVYPGLIMANGARMEGIEASLFFTFFGLDAVIKKYERNASAPQFTRTLIKKLKRFDGDMPVGLSEVTIDYCHPVASVEVVKYENVPDLDVVLLAGDPRTAWDPYAGESAPPRAKTVSQLIREMSRLPDLYVALQLVDTQVVGALTVEEQNGTVLVYLG